jgi:CRP-like cAMP-binding protein
VRAREPGVLVLSLNGDAFRGVIHVNPSIATGIIHTLARHLRDVERKPNP